MGLTYTSLPSPQCGHQQFAALFEGYIVLVAESRFQAAALRVDTGMDNAAVMTGLMSGKLRFLFNHQYRRTRIAPPMTT